MPVHKNPDGTYQFGKSGKKYSTLAKAKAQERAIYASGWRENSTEEEASSDEALPAVAEQTMGRGEVFFAKHIENGLAQYGDVNVLILDDVLNKMDETFSGCPLFIGHRDYTITDCNDGAVGYVVKSFLNKNDGAHWAEILVTKPEGVDAIRGGMRVSNSYIKSSTDKSEGKWHNIPYVEKVLEGHYEHLALVDNPRYENNVVLTPQQFEEYNRGKKEEAVLVVNSAEEDEFSVGERLTSELEAKSIMEEEKAEVKDLAEENQDLKTKLEEHKEFEQEEEENRKEAEDINKREAEVMDNGGCSNEVQDEKHEHDMEALDRRIADSFEELWRAKLADKQFWRDHLNSLEIRKEDDEKAEAEYKEERASNSLGVARAKQNHSMKYETISDFLARGNELYGK